MERENKARELLGEIDIDIRSIIFSYMILGRFPGDGSLDVYGEYLTHRNCRLKCMIFSYSGAGVDEGQGRALADSLGKNFPGLCVKCCESFTVCLEFCLPGAGEIPPEKLRRYISGILGRPEIKSYVGKSTTDLFELDREYRALCRKAETGGNDKRRAEGIFRLYALEEELLEKLMDGDMENGELAVEEIIRQTDETNGRDMTRNKGYFCFLWRYVDRQLFQRAGLRSTIPEKLAIDHELRSARTLEQSQSIIKKFLRSYSSALGLQHNGSHHRLIQRAKEFVRSNCSGDVSLESVSNYIGLSSTYMSKLFKKEEGINYKDFVMKVRMERAHGLLCQGGMNVSEVAAAVGYGNVDHFARTFKACYGINPRDLRLRRID